MLEALIARWGYWAIGVGAFFEGEAVLVAAGALAHKGLLSLPAVMLAAFSGSVAGDQLWFQLGRHYGRPLLERRPAWSARAEQVNQRLARYGSVFVFGFRFIYGVRTITPALLGMSGYSASRFAWLNLSGALVWAVAVGGAGWALGAALAGLLQRAAHVEELIAAALAVALLAWGGWRLYRRRTDVVTTSPPRS